MVIVTASNAKPCNKCGVLKSGQLSCCGKGGDWAQKCGHSNDSRFIHSWFDGILACQGKLTSHCVGRRSYVSPPVFIFDQYPTSKTLTPIATGETTAAVDGKVCPKCGINKKSGKRSCCAAGGAWASNCGETGNTDFDHTWLEGRQACEGTSASR